MIKSLEQDSLAPEEELPICGGEEQVFPPRNSFHMFSFLSLLLLSSHKGLNDPTAKTLNRGKSYLEGKQKIFFSVSEKGTFSLKKKKRNKIF